MGPPGPTKENAQLNRQMTFFYINQISILLKKENTMV